MLGAPESKPVFLIQPPDVASSSSADGLVIQAGCLHQSDAVRRESPTHSSWLVLLQAGLRQQGRRLSSRLVLLQAGLFWSQARLPDLSKPTERRVIVSICVVLQLIHAMPLAKDGSEGWHILALQCMWSALEMLQCVSALFLSALLGLDLLGLVVSQALCDICTRSL